jgi:hypothetical protein
MPYPTKKQILENEVKFKKPVIATILEWKNTFFKNRLWPGMNNEDKSTALRTLILKLSTLYDENLVQEKLRDRGWKINGYQLKVETGPDQNPRCEMDEAMKCKTIFLDSNRPSIVSSFHELAHALFGESELEACRWSIWLFKKTFPGSYRALNWKNHMLIK